ncbi:MAG: DUF4398 domain-containing protein [Spirochaetaceae bacterium]|jgi:hypothetical protein|nr:DUF4398 domain-containing protein [Spirochaetaceae bacterium]
MRSAKKFMLSGAILIALFAACAKPPVEDMDNAAAAVSKAENDPDVIAYSQSDLTKARESLDDMRTEADAKRYDEAKRLAQEVIAIAERAIQNGRNAAVRTRDEAAAALIAMEAALSETTQTIENARTAKQRGIDFEEIDRDLMDARAAADDARNANSDKRYRDAINASSATRNKLSSITAKIGQVSIAASRKK